MVNPDNIDVEMYKTLQRISDNKSSFTKVKWNTKEDIE